MPTPRHARIGFYTTHPGTLDAAVTRARAELVPVIQGEPGFRFYTAVRTGANTLASLSGWETAEQAEAAAQNLSFWVRKVLGPAVVSMENHLATVIAIAEASRASPVYGRVMDMQFQPGKAKEVSERAQTEFLPLLQTQPGFIRHVAFRVGEDQTITFAAFGTRAELVAAEEATEAWRASVSPLTTAIRRHLGEVVWSVHKD